MADDSAWGLLREEKRDFDAMRREYRKRAKSEGEAPPSLGEFQGMERPPIVAVLLDDLLAGESVAAAVLAWRSVNARQIITAYGSPAGGYFRLGYKASASASPVWTPLFYPAVDAPEVLQGYLSGIVGNGNVEVTLGIVRTTDGVSHNTWRWEIVFCGALAGIDQELLEVEETLVGGALLVQANNPLELTGRVELINEVLGVGLPTPLKAGARCMALWYHGIGYCIHACEVRDWGEYGLM